MNQKICKLILENKEKFIPNLFTERQIKIMEKYQNKEKMTKTEQTYLYSTIKKKTDALNIFSEEFYVIGTNFIQNRIKQAKDMLKKLNRKAFISGSFLFKDKYNDIDVFIISNKRHEKDIDNFHYIYIKESDLKKPKIYSAAKACISNFEIILPKVEKSKLHLYEELGVYQETIINILEKEDTKILRDLILDYSIFNLNKILDSREINNEYSKIIKEKDNIEAVSKLIKELIINNFNKHYIIDQLKQYIKTLDKDIKTIKLNDHLKIFKKTYEGIINECKRTKK